MSQHSDILSHEISKGIKRNLDAATIVSDIIDLLDMLGYPEHITDTRIATEHAYTHAKWMLTQKEGLYGISHAKLDKCITELWCKNQWVSA